MSFELKDNSKDIILALNQQSVRALEKCGLVAEGHAKVKAPVDTGALRNSISHKVVSEGTGVACYIGTNMEYAPYVEFGTGIFYDGGGRQTSWTYTDRSGATHMTGGQRAQPYLRPAISDHIDQYVKIVKQELQD